MDDFTELLSRITETVSALRDVGCDVPFFRGHGDATWQLKPSLARTPRGDALESALYYDMLTRAGSLVPSNCRSWDTLFIMQHHRIPTRLLDWTATFAVALYFDVQEFQYRAAVWVLNPFDLNQQQVGDSTLLHAQSDIYGEYFDYFITKERKFKGKPNVIAVLPNKTNQRVLAQKAVCPKHIYKFEFSANALEHARNFLDLAGINEYALFPDLDGLARWMKTTHRV